MHGFCLFLSLCIRRSLNKDSLSNCQFTIIFHKTRHYGYVSILLTASYHASTSNEPPRDKTNNVAVGPAQISLGSRPVWSEYSLSAWRKLGSLATHWAHSNDSDQTGRMPRLIWVFAGHSLTLLVLSQGGSNMTIFLRSLFLVNYEGLFFSVSILRCI